MIHGYWIYLNCDLEYDWYDYPAVGGVFRAGFEDIQAVSLAIL